MSAAAVAARTQTRQGCLTHEQRQLVTDHLWLADRIAISYATTRHLDHDEMIAVARVGLILAARTFRPSEGAFRKHAATRILGELLDEGRRMVGRSKEQIDFIHNTLRLDDPIVEDNGEEAPLTLLDTLEDRSGEHDPHLQACHGDLWEEVYRLPSREATVIGLLYGQDWMGNEVAEFLGVTEGRVTQIKRSALARLYDRIGTTYAP